MTLRRPGRLDKEIEIPIPNHSTRCLVNNLEIFSLFLLIRLKTSFQLKILRKKLQKLNHQLSKEELEEVAQNCHGYVGADLEMLVQEAALVCVKRLTKNFEIENYDTYEKKNLNESHEEKIKLDDLVRAQQKVKASAMREIVFDIPKVYWNQIGGQHDLKNKLQQAIIWPIKYKDSFKRLNIKPPRGLLMYGPPGKIKKF